MADSTRSLMADSSTSSLKDTLTSSFKGPLIQSPRTRPRLFWYAVGGLTFLIVLIPVLACGLYFGLRKSNDEGNTIPLVVDLGYSKYQGSHVENGVTQWLGIRYAAPPVGDLRFRAPRDPLHNDTLQIANKHGAACLSSPSMTLDHAKSEDCLFLDVYAPTSSSDSPHPVYVFFQGGGFNSNANPVMNANKLINGGDHNMVVVTLNYRVGPWGFLSSKEVMADGNLNNGLRDQRKVLEWVQTNIEHFNGNPSHVTIGGSSAGGASVDLQMTAYGGRDDNLFHAVAAESQSFGSQRSIASSQYQYDGLVSRVNCSSSSNTLQCLRETPVEILATHNIDIAPAGKRKGVFMWSPVIDGNFTTDQTYNLFAQGKFVKVPAIFGGSTNEGTVFTPKGINSTADMRGFLKENFAKLSEEQLAKIEELYPKAEQYPGKGEYWKTASNVYGDMRYTCPGIYISERITQAGAQSWNYRWNVLSSANAISGLGVTHAVATPSIWGVSPAPDNALTPTIQAYWTSFIRSKDPNTYRLKGAPRWETFAAENGRRVVFQNEVRAVGMEDVPGEEEVRCAFLSGIGPGIDQ
ncbi:related to cholinesterase precursor [Rhynchosporium secalis]|uniref:Related to cholinesterase n=1 Tax=Rhynchosporium secalis TaxID=38038 RepID=A0A1E1MKB1_RHYSE|nr:related to cholinesterase precursor [Rhynchosporium secalis]